MTAAAISLFATPNDSNFDELYRNLSPFFVFHFVRSIFALRLAWYAP
jgi:hypothetical protein